MKNLGSKKDSDNFLSQGKKIKEKQENKMLRQGIADNNKQHKHGSFNYISSTKKEVAKKMGGGNPAYESFKNEWSKKHSISKPPSQSSWKQFYKDK